MVGSNGELGGKGGRGKRFIQVLDMTHIEGYGKVREELFKAKVFSLTSNRLFFPLSFFIFNLRLLNHSLFFG